MGNVLYIEELYAKSDFRSNFSLFDNIFLKSGLALVWGFGFAKLLLYVLSKIKGVVRLGNFSKPEIFLLSSAALNFGVLFLSSDMYDRYLLPLSFFCYYFYSGG